MTHGHLRFHFAYCFKDYAYNDEKSGAAERDNVEKTTGHDVEDKRETSDTAKDQRAHQNDLVENLGDVERGRSAGTNAGDGTAVLHKVVGNLNRIEGDGNVEISKCDDQNEEQDRVDNAVGGKRSVEEVGLLYLSELHDRDRERNDRAREDDRHNAGHVELDREVGALTAVLLSADSALCVLNGNSSFGVRHIGYEDKGADDNENNGNPENDLEPNGNGLTAEDERVGRTFQLEVLVELNEHRGKTGYDIRKKDDGNTVTDTLLVNSFAEPHNQASAGSVASNDNEHCEPLRKALVSSIDNETATHRVEEHVVTVRRDHCDTYGYVAGNFFNLLSAFLACLGKSFKSGDRNGKQLHDNGCVDVRRYGESKKSCGRESIAGENVQVSKNTFLHIRCQLKLGVVNKRDRQCSAYTIQENDEEREQHLATKFGDRPCVS